LSNYKPQTAFFSNSTDQIDRVYGAAGKKRLAGLSLFEPGIFGIGELRDGAGAGVEYAFSSWAMPVLKTADLARLPKLKAVFYAAGSVQAFARPLLEKKIKVFSAWTANAVPVAEYALAQILLAGKGFLPTARALHSKGPEAWNHERALGNYGTTVSLLGAGMVGRKLIELLRPFKIQILVFDPHLTDLQARELGVEKVSLGVAFQRGRVVSNHLANVPETLGLLNEALFASMRKGATFLNTGRGATVDEQGLWRVLQDRPDLSAILDVMDPEPPGAHSMAYGLPNVFLSPHVAGSLGNELSRLADSMMDEFEAMLSDKPLRHEVSLSMLETMA
jgi:phosphoglycerate dehydrogenase-like enzyme